MSISHQPFPVPALPASWTRFFDEAVPAYVKTTYSPKESWKGKPFNRDDGAFFVKGIRELSDLFTVDRPGGSRRSLPQYLRHPRFRSSYLLYFFPFQAAKFAALFDAHPDAGESALDHARRSDGTLRLVDLGSGPGTATVAYLLWIVTRQGDRLRKIPRIEIDWFDTDEQILRDGARLLDTLFEIHPDLKPKVKLRTHVEPWWKAPGILQRAYPSGAESSLIFAGHLFNETAKTDPLPGLAKLFERASGAGMLFVEPASQGPSQSLSKLRDRLFEEEILSERAESLWGPCLHAGKCPLALGRDWCHFSVQAKIPGKWFKFFSIGLGSERDWLKFSYLWLASRRFPAPTPAETLRRVVSDRMRKTPKALSATLLLCEPERVGRIEIPSAKRIFRGDLIES